jgi:hypothetical protein
MGAGLCDESLPRAGLPARGPSRRRSGQDGDKRQAQKAGFDHHMVKPVDPQALIKLLSGLDTVKA